MLKGTIKKLIADQRFGFIQTADGKDIFFHRSGLQDVEFDSLREGMEVEFQKGQGRDGRLRAVMVRLSQSKSE